MTKDEKLELGRLLEKHGIKAVLYSELGTKQGMYHILYYDDEDDELKETKIYGKDLE